MTFKPRPYQIDPINIGVNHFLQKKYSKHGIIVSPTGGGKSFIVGGIAKGVQEYDKTPTLVLQPTKELLEQNVSKYENELQEKCSVFSASANSKNIGLVTYATLGSVINALPLFANAGVKHIIVDECFVAGTLIDGIAIEDIKVGDMVNSFNHDLNIIEKKRVVRLFRKDTDCQLLKVTLSNNTSFICTDNHPVFTKEFGYIEAKLLYLYSNQHINLLVNHNNVEKKNNDNTYKLQCLSKRSRFNRVKKNRLFKVWNEGVLLKRMFKTGSVSSLQKSPKRMEGENIGTHENQQSYVGRWGKRKNDTKIKGQKVCIKRGEWAFIGSASCTTQRHGISNRVCNKYKTCKGEFSKNTKSLQIRFGSCGTQTINRSRWQRSSTSIKKSTRREKDCGFEFSRLASVEVYKSRDRREFNGVCEKNTVYNFEVEDNNNYFANGVLVHNCHLYPSDSDSMFSKLLKGLGNGVRLLGLTATPFRLENNLAGSRLMMLPKCRPSLFKQFIHITQIKDIAAKYWSPLEYEIKRFDGSMLKINTNGTEYTDESLKRFAESNLQSCYEALMDDRFKHVLCFMKSVSMCQKLVKMIPDCAFICSDTSIISVEKRAEIIRDFKNGKINRLLNVNILAVGFDFPELDHIIISTPTMSLGRWYQIVGRGVRISPLKEKCTITDLCGMVARFGRVEDITIEDKGSGFEVYAKGKQISSIVMKSSYTPPEVTIDSNSTFKDLELDFGKFRGQKISECPDWYLEFLKGMTFKPKFAKQASIFLQKKALEK